MVRTLWTPLPLRAHQPQGCASANLPPALITDIFVLGCQRNRLHANSLDFGLDSIAYTAVRL
jgi:hypothetical protein